MKVQEEMNTASAEAHEAKKLTLKENLVLTIEVLLGFGLLGTVLWMMSAWATAS